MLFKFTSYPAYDDVARDFLFFLIFMLLQKRKENKGKRFFG